MPTRAKWYGMIVLCWILGAVYAATFVPLYLAVMPQSWMNTLDIRSRNDLITFWMIGCFNVLLFANILSGTWAERKKKKVFFFILSALSTLIAVPGSMLILLSAVHREWDPLLIALVAFIIDAVFIRTLMAHLIRNHHYVPPEKR